METNGFERGSILCCFLQCGIEHELNIAYDCTETRALGTQNSMNFIIN